ncbi:MAG: hypothetical protein K6G40_07515 [Eubacterium sp.]|nr:hypothetical protein [Eubacterium sp.]
MKRVEIAIYDSEADFVMGLMLYMSRYKGDSVRTSGFWEKEKFEEHLKDNRADIILVPLGFDLKETSAQIMHVTDKDGGEGIYKYMPADEIIREIFLQYDIQAHSDRIGKKVSLRAVYSPSKSIYQTPFAVTYAMTLAAKEKVLYVNLCENAGFESIMQMSYERDLSDLIYSSGHYSGDMDRLVLSMGYETNGFTYIPPMKNPADIYLLKGEEWIDFINKLSSLSGFDVVILDIGGMIPGFYKILEECDSVYMPYSGNPYERARLAQFEEIIKKGKRSEITEIIKRIKMPGMDNIFFDGDMVMCWQWGEMGDYVRGVVKREEMS